MAMQGGLGLPRRLRELGRLRAGTKGMTEKGKEYPKKLSEWRITSPSLILLTHAAELYGGEVHTWEGAPTEGTQYELFTTTDTLDVLIPPGSLSAHWEMWSKGGCQRRCNGAVQETGEMCACPADLEERLRQSRLLKPTACKPMTRLSVVLPRLPDVGVWRVTTSSINAGIEMPGTVDLLEGAMVNNWLIPASLIIDQRTDVQDGQTRHFSVPVLSLHTVTVTEIQAGRVAAGAGNPQPPVETAAALPNGGDAPRQIAAPKSQPVREPAPSIPQSPVEGSSGPSLTDRKTALIERIGAQPTNRDRLACMNEFKVNFGHPAQIAADRIDDAEAWVADWRPEPPSAPPASPTPDPAPPTPTAAPEPPESADPGQVRVATETLAAELAAKIGPPLPAGITDAMLSDDRDLTTDERLTVGAAWEAHPDAMQVRLDWLMAREDEADETAEPPLPLGIRGEWLLSGARLDAGQAALVDEAWKRKATMCEAWLTWYRTAHPVETSPLPPAKPGQFPDDVQEDPAAIRADALARKAERVAAKSSGGTTKAAGRRAAR